MRVDGNTTLLPEERMRELGFTDHVPEKWRFSRWVGPEIFFTLSIDKDTGDYSELVEDVTFGQPYHYRTYDVPAARKVEINVDNVVEELRGYGFDISVDHNEYDLRRG